MAKWGMLLAFANAICLSSVIADVIHEPGQRQLISWIKECGGEVGLEVAAVNKGGLRGTTAARDFQEGDVVASLPRECTILVGLSTMTAPELAAALLRMRQEAPEEWAFFAPYWDSLPVLGGVSSKYVFKEEHAPLLQDADMAEFMEYMREHLREVFERSGDEGGMADLAVSLEEFEHYTALVDSYSFGFPSDTGDAERVMLPLLDLINHKGDANTAVTESEDKMAYLVIAIKNIRKGDEVTHRYNWSIERNDKALVDHFFVSEQQPPQLCTMDLPWHTIYDVLDEPPYANKQHAPGGPLCTQAEAQRLAGILAAFPTTEQQDQELLDSGRLLDWRERVIVRFRMLRKQALRLTIEGIEAALAKGRPKPVVPLKWASDKLQEPLFIQIGSGNVAEL